MCLMYEVGEKNKLRKKIRKVEISCELGVMDYKKHLFRVEIVEKSCRNDI